MAPLTDSDLAALLSQSVQRLNEGDVETAEKCLEQVLATRPELPQAQMLMATVRLTQGRAAEAQTVLEQVLATCPGQPMVLFTLGNARKARGNPMGALDAYRGAQRSRPDFPANELALGSTLSDLNQHAEAEGILEPLSRRAAQSQIAPEIENALGTAKMMQRRFAEALPHFERAIAVRPDFLAAEKNRATTLECLRQPERAANIYRRVLAQDPLDLKTHLLLNELLHRSRDTEEFLRSYDRAREARPGSPVPLVAKADQLLQTGRAAEAQDYYRGALHLYPAHASAHIGMGRTMTALGDHEAALVAFEAGDTACPDDPDLQTAYAACLLGHGDAAKALSLAQRANAASPFSQSALAVLGLCYRAQNDAREETLNGYEDLVRIYDLEPPAGYSDIAAFHRALGQHLEDLHAEAGQFFSQTLRGGTRSFEDFFRHQHVLRDQLKGRIAQAVERYIATMRVSPDHPFLGRRKQSFSFSGSWTSQMRDGGFHLNHIHNGWISSVYYVEVPEVAEDQGAKQGWLKFGEPSPDLGFQNSIRRFVQPKPGRLVLFPSYLWHGTVPYYAPARRTTIAFDVIPH